MFYSLLSDLRQVFEFISIKFISKPHSTALLSPHTIIMSLVWHWQDVWVYSHYWFSFSSTHNAQKRYCASSRGGGGLTLYCEEKEDSTCCIARSRRSRSYTVLWGGGGVVHHCTMCWMMPQKVKKMSLIQFEYRWNDDEKKIVIIVLLLVQYIGKSTIV